MVLRAIKHCGIKLELIEKQPWQECLKRKSKCHVTVDQFTLGYGCNAIEAWMFGQPVVANSDKGVLNLMREQFGGDLPFVQCPDDYRKLASTLVRLRDDIEFYGEWAGQGYAHAMRFHSPVATSERAIEYYHLAIDKFYRRTHDSGVYIPPADPHTRKVRWQVLPHVGPNEMLLVSLGGNAGKETISGPVTNKKYRYTNDVPFVVDVVDGIQMLQMMTKPPRSRSKAKQKPPTNLFAKVTQ